jgi:FAD/FMN-containing dehydrogenase
MRANGYTCDKLVETEIVLPDGRQLVCSETQNSDLFWVCWCAGGGNYGIHTFFTFDTFPVSTITIFLIKWATKLPALFEAVQTLIKTAPDNFGMKMSVDVVPDATGPKTSLSILGQLAGSEATLRSMLAPLLAIASPVANRIEVQPYWKGQEIISEEGDPEYLQKRSRFIKGYFDQAAIQKVFDNINAWPGTSKAATWKFFLLGGEIDKKAPDDMASIHRATPCFPASSWNGPKG